MKKIIVLLIVFLLTAVAASADIKVTAIKGIAQVRHGVNEQWTSVSVGDILKPEDSMRSGKKSSITIMIDGKNRLIIPESAIIDISDLRRLTQEEFLLMLTMERVRSVPPQNHHDDFIFPHTTTLHGEHREMTATPLSSNPEMGLMQLSGARVLYKHGFYATCILKTKQVFRLNPSLQKNVDIRFIIANAFEKMKLVRDALSEYTNLSQEQLPPQQRNLIDQKIAQLKSKLKG